MDEKERLLKLYQYCVAMCDRMNLDSCVPCPFFHQESKECGLGILRSQFRNVAFDSHLEANAFRFDDDAEKKYNEIANEISLEEFKIELMDFGRDYCFVGKSCNRCRFYSDALNKCVFNWVDKKLKKLLDVSNTFTP